MASTVTFNTLLQQIFTSTSHGSASCDAIKSNRHCGTHHVELDTLQTSLQTGLVALKAAADAAAAKSPSDKDLAAADDAMAGYAKEMRHVCHKLDKIATGHHEKGHGVQHPHFKELRGRWEEVLKGVLGLLEGLKETGAESEAKVEVKEKKTEKNKEEKGGGAKGRAKADKVEKAKAPKEESEVKEVEVKMAEVKIEEVVEIKEHVEAK